MPYHFLRPILFFRQFSCAGEPTSVVASFVTLTRSGAPRFPSCFGMSPGRWPHPFAHSNTLPSLPFTALYEDNWPDPQSTTAGKRTPHPPITECWPNFAINLPSTTSQQKQAGYYLKINFTFLAISFNLCTSFSERVKERSIWLVSSSGEGKERHVNQCRTVIILVSQLYSKTPISKEVKNEGKKGVWGALAPGVYIAAC